MSCHYIHSVDLIPPREQVALYFIANQVEKITTVILVVSVSKTYSFCRHKILHHSHLPGIHYLSSSPAGVPLIRLCCRVMWINFLPTLPSCILQELLFQNKRRKRSEQCQTTPSHTNKPGSALRRWQFILNLWQKVSASIQCEL